MAQVIRMNGAAGPFFPAAAAVSTAEERALAAMQAGGVRGMVWPTYGTAADMAVISATERYVQDYLFPAVEYCANVPTTGAPTITVSSSAPSMTWAGVANARGWRAERALAAGEMQCAAGAVGANPDFWLWAVAQLGTLDGDTQVIGGVNTSYTGYGDALIHGASGVMIAVLGDKQFSFAAGSGDARTVPHVFAARYTAANDTLRLYVDGVLSATHVVQTAQPGTAIKGGCGYFGGRAGSLAQEQLNAANSAFRGMGFGNGAMTGAQWADVHIWLKSVFSIA